MLKRASATVGVTTDLPYEDRARPLEARGKAFEFGPVDGISAAVRITEADAETPGIRHDPEH